MQVWNSRMRLFSMALPILHLFNSMLIVHAFHKSLFMVKSVVISIMSENLKALHKVKTLN